VISSAELLKSMTCSKKCLSAIYVPEEGKRSEGDGGFQLRAGEIRINLTEKFDPFSNHDTGYSLASNDFEDIWDNEDY
jgi:hypothetical protein